ncbi:hypothetical protein [Nostoc sp.]|uniref:hypothetical protein n=1 Tax=Nostoc sp. TaxID=1180 RepID=UPI002FF7B6F8
MLLPLKISALVQSDRYTQLCVRLAEVMAKPIGILLQTTIPTTEDDWSIFRFSMLQDYLAIQFRMSNKILM